jgi:hypothetical protein
MKNKGTVTREGAVLVSRKRIAGAVFTCVPERRRLWTDRSREAVVIFLFGLDPLYNSFPGPVHSFHQTLAAIGSYNDQTSF